MIILSQPEFLSPAGNINDFIISTNETLRFRLYKGETLLLDHQYQPNLDGKVTICIGDIILNSLSVNYPDNDCYIQENIVANFTADISNIKVNFRAIKCGIDRYSGDFVSFLLGNFLTWQPQLVETRYAQPQWLTYYNPSNDEVLLKVKFYLTDGSSSILTIATIAAGECRTCNIQFAYIWGLIDAEKYGYYDVYTEDLNGTRLSYIQRYTLVNTNVHDTTFIFENTLGGIDSVVFTGSNTYNPEFSFGNVVYSGQNVSKYNNPKGIFSQNSGYKTQREALWLKDFFITNSRYIIKNGSVLPIVVDEASLSFSNLEELQSFEFKYKLTNDNIYQNIARADTLSDVPLGICTPDNLVLLPPRLVEFGKVTPDDSTLIPVQSPYHEKWSAISLRELKTYLDNITLSSGLMIFNRLDSWDDYKEEQGYVLSALLGYALKEYIEKIEKSLDNYQLKGDPITDMPTAETVSSWGFTKNLGTITGIIMNGSSKGNDGIIDLGTVITSHQDISGKLDKLDAEAIYATKTQVNAKADKISLAIVATSGSYNDLLDKPTIPSEVTESTVSSWGFTKNTGTYSKPSTGIPKSDLASAVQSSLGKADTALQSYTEKYTGTYNKPSTGIPKSDLASAVQSSLGKADTALQSITATMVTTALGYTPYNLANFTKASVKSILGISDWALASSKPTYSKSDVGLANVTNLAASGYLTDLSSNTTYAISITIGGTTKSITVSTLKSSLGLGSLAYKSSLAASDIPSLPWSKIGSGKPTTVSGYGITDAITTANINAQNVKSATKLTTPRSIWGQSFDGTKDVDGDMSINGNCVCTGESISGRAANSSDERLKKNITTLSPEYCLAKAKELIPSEWDWKEDGKHSVGFIAQEVKNILPFSVTAIEDVALGEKLYLQYNQLIAIAIGSIQQLDKEVNELKRELQKIKEG